MISCEYCAETFVQKNNLLQHFHNIHFPELFKIKKLKCPECNKEIGYKRNLARHMREKHNPTKAKFRSQKKTKSSALNRKSAELIASVVNSNQSPKQHISQSNDTQQTFSIATGQIVEEQSNLASLLSTTVSDPSLVININDDNSIPQSTLEQNDKESVYYMDNILELPEVENPIDETDDYDAISNSETSEKFDQVLSAHLDSFERFEAAEAATIRNPIFDSAILSTFVNYNWQPGQIVWASMYTNPFWPAIILNCSHESQKNFENSMQVMFLCTSVDCSWVDVEAGILPFKGQTDFEEKCKLPKNRRKSAYRCSPNPKWKAAVAIATFLEYIDIPYRIEFSKQIMKMPENILKELTSLSFDAHSTPKQEDSVFSGTQISERISKQQTKPQETKLQKPTRTAIQARYQMRSLQKHSQIAEHTQRQGQAKASKSKRPLANRKRRVFVTPSHSAQQKLRGRFRQRLYQIVRTSKKENETLRSQPKLSEKPSKEKSNIEKQLLSFCLKKYPRNFILEDLQKNPVCQYCLESGIIMKCAGKCSGYFHKDCFEKHDKTAEYYAILKRKLNKETKEVRFGTKSIEIISSVEENVSKLQCVICTVSQENLCFVCFESANDVISCCEKNCGKSYHIECLRYWPQHTKSYASNKINRLSCSRHVCHTCASPNIRNQFSTVPDKKLIKCMQCPGTYHRSSECIPAGSELLSESQLICARHTPIENSKRISIDFCLFCSLGGSLICCDTCVYAFHKDCLEVPVGDNFICEECESGRRPLYGEIVWCKYACNPWWPAITVPPPCIPKQVLARKTKPNTICVFFFGTHDFGWVNQTRIYLYLKGDTEWKNNNEKELLKNSIDEAEQWMQRFNEIIEKSDKPNMRKNKPPPYKKLKANRVIAKFTDCMEYNECACRPDDPAPCSLESNCYNALLNFECDPKLCPARSKCQNQNFLRGEQYAFQVKMTDSKGWGLYAVDEIPVDKFVMEYMGEVIDNVEFDHRFSRATANKDDNYYFLTLGKNLYIDAAIYGNKARFINHSCNPNVVPNKWTVYSSGQKQIRIGFFAVRDISMGEEITFNYNWGKTKNMQTVCRCGSEKCRGHI